MQYGRELLKGSTDGLLLHLISQQPMYGYQIIKELDRQSGGYFRFREGTLYPALHRLERQGLLSSQWQRSPGGQERRYYTLTLRGQRVLEAKMAEWHSFSQAVNLVLRPATA